MGVVIPEGKKIDELNAQLGLIARALSGDTSGVIENHTMTQAIIRAGLAKSYFATGDLYKADKESGISTTYHGDAISAVTVNEESFIAKVGSHTHGYEFLYDGHVWHMEGQEAELTEYGISVTGTPAENDVIVVHVQGSTLYFEVLDLNDFDVPINPALTHTIPLLSRDILSYGVIAFCPPQMLKAITADEFPSGMPAGTYSLGLDHAAYNNGTTQDGTVNFTTTQIVPVGGGIRHTAIGVYQSGSYTRAQILDGTFTTYDASGNVIESGLTTSDGASGTSLGTATAEDASTYAFGNAVNLTRRQGHGSNYALGNYIRKWLRSNKAGAGSGQVASWWDRVSIFDLPIKSTLPGFRHGLDPEFDAIICPVRKRTLLNAFDRTDDKAYVDSEETIWQISMTEMGFGANSGVYECGVKADGTVNRGEAYELYKDANANRLKYDGTTARYWFLRSPNPSYAYFVRFITPSGTGSLHDNHAFSSSGAVGGLCIG